MKPTAAAYALDLPIAGPDSRDPILAAKDAAAKRRREAPAAREAARELLRELSCLAASEDDGG